MTDHDADTVPLPDRWPLADGPPRNLYRQPRPRWQRAVLFLLLFLATKNLVLAVAFAWHGEPALAVWASVQCGGMIALAVYMPRPTLTDPKETR